MNLIMREGEFMLLQNFISQTSQFIAGNGIKTLYLVEDISKIFYSSDVIQHLHMGLVDIYEQQSISDKLN